MKILVRDLKPNPFRRMEKGYPIDRAKVESLKDSIAETTFWDNLLARKNGDDYELAYGHHRWVALKELGIEEVNIPVKALDDKTMLKIMANENMEQWSWNVGVINETVEAVRDFIRDSSPTLDSRFDWTTAIKTFLGKGWSEAIVKSALATISADEITEKDEAKSEAEVEEAVEEAKETKTKPKRKRVKRAVNRKAVETFTIPAHADVIRALLTSTLYGGLLAKSEQEKFVKKMYREMIDGKKEITTSSIKEKFLDSILQRFKPQIDERKEEQERLKKALEKAKPEFEKLALKASKEWTKVAIAILKVKIKASELDQGGVDKVEKLIERIESRIAAWRRS